MSAPLQVTWPFTDPDRVVLAGDWHGNAPAAQAVVEAAVAVGAPAVVQLGDFGLWPGESGARYVREVNAAASSAGVFVAWVDGNHEDFDQLDATPVSQDGLQWQASHLARIPRGSRWQWHGVRCAALGGATSLDRPSRTVGVSWWLQEGVTDRDLALLASGGDCDVLFTHDCPAGVDIPGIEHRDFDSAVRSSWPLGELERAWEHRDRMREAVQATRPLYLWHGHYHLRYSTLATLHDRGVTQVDGLSWDGEPLDSRAAVVDFTRPRLQLQGVRDWLTGRSHRSLEP